MTRLAENPVFFFFGAYAGKITESSASRNESHAFNFDFPVLFLCSISALARTPAS